jgi:prepilin-type N-terminal cleavage/methylation domain-containing protein
MRSAGNRKRREERGVTLIELMVAITLVAAIATGMLMAARTSLTVLQKVDTRLQSNRRVMSVEQILARELGGVMPVMGDCLESEGMRKPCAWLPVTRSRKARAAIPS